MINYGLRNNLPSNTIYNSQVGALIFCCCLVFRISSLPGLISDYMHSSTLWVYLLLAAFELVGFTFVYVFFRFGGDSFLTSVNSKAYKLILVVLAAFMTMKVIIFYSYSSLFLAREMFINATPMLFFIVLLIPIIYLGIKGVRTIARTAEIFMILLFIGLMINLVFLKTELDIGRNMPILSMEPSAFFKGAFKYGFWLGDAMPLLFIKMQKKKLPYVGMSVFTVFALIIVTVLLGVAMYGDSLSYVANLTVELAGFNQLSLEIGRMEWIALIVVITMAIISLSTQFWGITACCERICKTKKPAQIIFPALLIAVIAGSPSLQAVADIALTEAGYVFFAVAIGAPLSILAVFAYNKKKFPEEYEKNKPLPEPPDTRVNTQGLNNENKGPAALSPSPLEETGGTPSEAQ